MNIWLLELSIYHLFLRKRWKSFYSFSWCWVFVLPSSHVILKVVLQVVLVLPIQPTLFVSGFRRTVVGFRLFSAERVDALCLSTLRFFLIISWDLIPRPLGRKYLIPIPIPSCLLRGSLFWFLAVRWRQQILYTNRAKVFSIETELFRWTMQILL